MEQQDLSSPQLVLLNDLQYQLNRLPEELRTKFLLVLAVSERAKQIVTDPNRSLTVSEENAVTQALREISEGRFQIRVSDDRFLRALKGQPEDADIFPYRP
ncbi:DNA-directed RNA polymerase subunit omega [bacterium HR17]|uniref:DNA-directed RNA polymerase subunit omega n=1 Tax=Candidatus Fervidibacter japonicus TaxID=2035412 RepID=A0A2H5XEJ7_9BACT|nr:DNA-directed RNA polymerase subunit omega [bacterium HR17]